MTSADAEKYRTPRIYMGGAGGWNRTVVRTCGWMRSGVNRWWPSSGERERKREGEKRLLLILYLFYLVHDHFFAWCLYFDLFLRFMFYLPAGQSLCWKICCSYVSDNEVDSQAEIQSIIPPIPSSENIDRRHQKTTRARTIILSRTLFPSYTSGHDLGSLYA